MQNFDFNELDQVVEFDESDPEAQRRSQERAEYFRKENELRDLIDGMTDAERLEYNVACERARKIKEELYLKEKAQNDEKLL